MRKKPRVGIAFQSSSILGGSISAGVVRSLVDHGAFEDYNIDAFSGTNTGGIVATVCWWHVLRDRIPDLPSALENLWMDLASELSPNPEVARLLIPLYSLVSINPLFRAWSDWVAAPVVQSEAIKWLSKHIPIDDIAEARESSRRQEKRVPNLVLGALDVLSGEQLFFSEDDLSLDILLATGFLFKGSGSVTIEAQRQRGSFCSGVWGQNPPIAPLVDCGVDEIWVVETLPKKRQSIPTERDEIIVRQEELWQTMLLEQELASIENMNTWIRTDSLCTERMPYKLIKIKRMPMLLDLSMGAKYVSSRSLLREMLEYGYSVGDKIATQKVLEESYNSAAKRFLFDSVKTRCQAVACIKNHRSGDALIVGHTYIVETGIEMEKGHIARDIAVSPSYLQGPSDSDYEISLIAREMAIEPSNHQSFRFDPEHFDHRVEFRVSPRTVGDRKINIVFFQNRNCVAQIDFDVCVKSSPQS